ncbi:MAG: peptidoglycan DD-metalloendopeptidase family protein, partial [Candidatus Omnitrophota bacterium]
MASNIWKFLQYGVCIGTVVMMTGCVPRKPLLIPVVTPIAVEKKGVQHKVRKGETLWRIAKTYKVFVEDIIQSNGIPNAASIEENQLIFIPGADRVLDIPVSTPTDNDSDYAWPVKGKVMAYFGDRKGAWTNEGIDVRVAEGEFVRAARSGRVVFADHLPGYGVTIILDHGDGFSTVYGHNAKVMAGLGDSVLRGDKIAQVAREGELT